MRVFDLPIGAALLLLSGSLASAGVLRVPEDYPTIQLAVDAAVSGDSVLVGPGTWTDRETRGSSTACVFIGVGVSLIGTGGAENTIVDLEGEPGDTTFTHVIRATSPDSILIKGLTITGHVGPIGAAIGTWTATVAIDSCRIVDNQGIWDGTILAYSDLILTNCELSNNSAVEDVTFGVLGDLFVEGCEFSNNHGPHVLYADGGQFTMRSTEFVGNAAGASYAIWSGSETTEISDCIVRENTSGFYVANLVAQEGSVRIEGCRVENNQSTGHCVYIESDSSEATENVFLENVSDDGATLYVWGDTEVTFNTFAGDSCPSSYPVLQVLDGEVANNTLVDCHGGGVRVFDGVEFRANVVAGVTGGVGAKGDSGVPELLQRLLEQRRWGLLPGLAAGRLDLGSVPL